MDATAALLGALIGAVTAVVSAALTSIVALRNERLRREESKRAIDTEALRKETGIVFREFFAIQHSMEWVTWFAGHDPDAVDRRLVESYDTEIHAAYPRLLGAAATVASLDLAVYEELRPLLRQVYELEETVALALHSGATIGGRQQASLVALAELQPAVTRLERTLPPELARIMKAASAA